MNQDSNLERADGALRRHALVEAYYWMDRAAQDGSAYARGMCRRIRLAWHAAGGPAERDNFYPGFSEQQGEIARLKLCLACGINRNEALARLEELMAREAS